MRISRIKWSLVILSVAVLVALWYRMSLGRVGGPTAGAVGESKPAPDLSAPLASWSAGNPWNGSVAGAATPRGIKIVSASQAAPRFTDARFPLRLRNTPEPLDQLIRQESALLLRHALIDSGSAEPLVIPDHLRCAEESGAYLVQAREAIDDSFRGQIQEAGGRVVAYIPNNAFLVRLSRAAAVRLEASSSVGALLPYEPYFKFDATLLPIAVEQRALSEGTRVQLTINEDLDTVARLEAMAGPVLSRTASPFGPVLTFEPVPTAWISLALDPDVHHMETARPRVLANDLTGHRVGATLSDTNTIPYLGLQGAGVLVNLNDSGVDALHQDLAGKVSSPDLSVLRDREGHGTHVAGIIAGFGRGRVAQQPQGSVTNASFRGKAPQANLYVLPVDLKTGPKQSDEFLQTNAAAKKTFISNNSWSYLGAYDYTSASASYDGAVRDAQPRETGSQPILYVFAAGNDGGGNKSGIGGTEDTISSPSNAKNVLTVGALESPRFLTNFVVLDTNGVVVPRDQINTNLPPETYTTNVLYFEASDSDTQVAHYSSRGNTGIGVEGDAGRFKPDVVAPGSFIISTRSRDWKLENQVEPNSPESYVLGELNQQLATNVPPDQQYRYESGTSMAAPAVTGILALMQEFFQNNELDYSPALFKALLINGARPTDETTYSINPDEPFNYSGWGRVQLTNSVPLAWGKKENINRGSNSPTLYVPESYTNALSTATSRAWRLELNPTNAATAELRLTLVWTDPPGNPGASVKLVNDLDLIVSNVVDKTVYIGNSFYPRNNESVMYNLTATNSWRALPFDKVNNVESIVLRNPGTNYVVFVNARRVNVPSLGKNSPTQSGRTNQPTLQDFALVVSSGDGGSLPVITRFAPTNSLVFPVVFEPDILTNGHPRLDDRAGENSPRLGTQRGITNQWHFYTFTNRIGETNVVGNTTNIAGTNLAFVTFLPNELAVPRAEEADIDLYVSTNAALLQLHPDALASAFKAVTRGGTEVVLLTNDAVRSNVVYYIGVKSEDHQGGSYGFIGLSSNQRFSDQKDGMVSVRGINIRMPIPDGSPGRPGVGITLAIATSSFEVGAIEIFQTLSHQNFSDLLLNLTHLREFSVLHNHRPYYDWYQNHYVDGGVNITNVYNDSGLGFRDVYYPPDGPGSLNNYLGTPINGVWMLNAVDNALGSTGFVSNFRMTLEENDLSGFRHRKLAPGRCRLEVQNVPADVSRMTVLVTNQNPALPLQVYIQRDEVPDILVPTNNLRYAEILPPGGSVSIGVRDVPPLTPGRYFITVCNLNGVTVEYDIGVRFERNLDSRYSRIFLPTNSIPLKDLALVDGRVTVDDARPVTAVRVGLRLTNEFVSDLKVALVNPSGQRVVLTENRGALTNRTFGSQIITLDFQHVALTYEAEGRASLFHNGNRVAESLLPGITLPTNRAFFFGEDPTRLRAPSHSPVILDDFGFWRRSLTDLQLRDVYARGLFRQPKGSPADLLLDMTSYWPFDTDSTERLNGLDGVDQGSVSTVVGRIAGARKFFGTNGLSRVESDDFLNFTDRGRGSFTLEGWVRVSDPVSQVVIAGWGDDKKQFSPALLVGFPPPLGNGVGSLSAVFRDPDGRDLVVSSAAGLVTMEARATNSLYANFTEYTNVTPPELIKFATGGFDGQREFFAEEPMTSLLSQVGAGAWRLEVTDDRVGGAIGVVSSWQLSLTFAPTNIPTVQLTNGLSYSNCIAGSQQLHFLMQVPSEARQATNLLANLTGDGGIDLIYSDSGVPDGNQPDDVFLLEDIHKSARYTLKTNLPPVLQRGQRYYLTVRNRDPHTTNCFRLRVDLGVPIIPLSDGVPYVASYANEGLLGFFQYDVPADSLETSFVVTNANQDVNLVLRQGPNLPTKSTFNYSSTHPGLTPEVIIAGLGSEPIPLLPGRWYLAVYPVNSSVPILSPIQYTIVARTTRGKLTPVIGDSPLTRTNTTGGIDYFSIDVAGDPIALVIGVTNLQGAVNAVLRRASPLPTPTSFDYSSARPGTSPEEFVIGRDSRPVPISPGKWILGVYPTTAGTVRYSVSATVQVDPGTLNPLTEDFDLFIDSGGQIPFTNYFSLTLPGDATAATFHVSQLTGDADLFARRAALPDKTGFDFLSANPGTNDEIIRVDRAVFPRLSGDWYLAVVSRDALATNYVVRFSFNRDPTAQPVLYTIELAPSGDRVVIRWVAIPGRSYVIQEAAGLAATLIWTDMATVEAATAVGVYELALPADGSFRFYRVIFAP
ncbi:MAG: hypothetical protein EXS36_12065 [Pedosphaera sp.]|nr:hypothetical protein [Pedosphaera sp.]